MDSKTYLSRADWIKRNYPSAQAIADRFRDDISELLQRDGINWDAIANTVIFPASDKQYTDKGLVIEKAHRGSIKVWTRSERDRDGNEYPVITWNNHKAGKGGWNPLQLLADEYDRERGQIDLERLRKRQEKEHQRQQEREAREAAEALRQQQEHEHRKAEFDLYFDLFQSAERWNGKGGYLANKQCSAVADHCDIRLITDPTTMPDGREFRMAAAYGEAQCVKLQNIYGQYAGLQRLYFNPEQEKATSKLQTRALEDEQTGAFVVIGDLNNATEIKLAEGFATGASIFLALDCQYPVVVCISADNMLNVIRKFKQYRPDLKMEVMTDNDCWKQGNTGRRNGLLIVQELGVAVRIPTVAGIDTEKKPTDFNDIHCLHPDGLKEVSRQLKSRGDNSTRIRKPPSVFDYHLERLSLANKKNAQKLAETSIASGLKLSPVKYTAKEIYQRVCTAIPDYAEIDKKKIISRVKWLARKKMQMANKPRSISRQKLLQPNVNYMTVTAEPDEDGHMVLPEKISDIIDALKGIIILRSPMATSKTDRAIAKMFQKSSKAVYIAHRVSLVGDAAGRLEAENYQSINSVMVPYIARFATCVNSIINPKFDPFFTHVKDVCIDEAAQTFRHVSNGESVDKPARVMDRLLDIMRSAERVLMCDADANDELIEIAETARPGETVHVIEMKLPMEHFCLQSADYDTVYQLIRESVAAGQRCVIATDSSQEPEAIATQLRNDAEKAGRPLPRILAINAETKGESDAQAFLENANEECQKYDVIVYSPAISSGLSIKVKNVFDHVYGLFHGVVSPSDCLQMLRRYRDGNTFTVGFKPMQLNLETDRARIWAGLIEADKINAIRVEESDDEVALIRKKHLFDNARISTISNDRMARMDFANNVLLIARTEGWQLRVLDEDSLRQDIGAQARKISRKDVKAQQVERIMNAPDCDESRGLTLARTEMLTRDEAAELERFKIRSQLACDDIDLDDVEFWDDGRGMGHLKRFEILQGTDEQCQAFDQFERDNRVYMSNRKFKLAKWELLDTIFRKLGLDKFTGTGEFDVTQANELLQWVARDDDSVMLFNEMRMGAQINRHRLPRCPMTFAKNILASIGLETVSLRTNKKRTRAILPEAWETMSAYYNRRQGAGISSLSLPDIDEARASAPVTPCSEPSDDAASGAVTTLHENGYNTEEKSSQEYDQPAIISGDDTLQLITRAAEAAGINYLDGLNLISSDGIRAIERLELTELMLRDYFTSRLEDMQADPVVVNQ